MSHIRVIAIAVISRRSDGALLVYDGYDTVKRERYHRPLGGGIEFGETAEDAFDASCTKRWVYSSTTSRCSDF